MNEQAEAKYSPWVLRVLALGVILALTGLLGWMVLSPLPSSTSTGAPDAKGIAEEGDSSVEAHRRTRVADPRYIDFGSMVFWWDALPKQLHDVALETGPQSNIHRDDYAGPESCRECHQNEHEQWWEHPHRRMNAVADEANVEGDFSCASIEYMGGRAHFYTEDGQYRMRLERGPTHFVYEIRQTIGSRFFQYYIGRIVEGPYDAEHAYRTVNHVLPFGYWLDRKMWVPVVHVGGERPDGLRDDPFAPAARPRKGEDYSPYAANCSMCHTTFPLADDLTRKPREIAKHVPVQFHWNMADYFREQHPELWGKIEHPADVSNDGIHRLPEQLMDYEADEHAVTLGISCEACHLGSRAHAEDPKIKPDFHPHSPYLFVQTEDGQLKTGRVQQNLNWACGRCHVGERPQFAAGMATWNSVEYSDAMQGSCYSQLKCIDCHSPHKAIGHRWSKTQQQDDQSCIRCHSEYQSEEAVRHHTHHDAGTSGSRCMNCHMPRINEGLQDVVRTHTIFSPTNAEMIKANHPNACNLCHTDKPIDWTLDHLEQWYGATFSEAAIAQAYPQRDAAVAAGWMESDYEPVRLVGADAACRTNNRTLLPELLKMLDDPFLLNRQFTAARLERMLDIQLDTFGYRFYASSTERAGPLDKLRAEMAKMERMPPVPY